MHSSSADKGVYYTFDPAQDVDVFVAKFSASGEVLWNASAALASSERDSCEGLAVLDDGDVVLGGAHGYGASRALWFAKLDGSTGATKWSRTFALTDRVSLSADTAIAQVVDLAADANGDVAFAGTLWGQIDFGGSVGTLVVQGSTPLKWSPAMRWSSSWTAIRANRCGADCSAFCPARVRPLGRGKQHRFRLERERPCDIQHADARRDEQWLLRPGSAEAGGQDGSTLCTRTYEGEENQTSAELVINRRGTGNAIDQAIVLGWFTKVIDFGGLFFRPPHDLAFFLMRYQP
jgi:hypothetical protein